MPRRAAALYAAAFTLLMAWGFWQAVSALRTPDSQNRLGQVMNLPSFLGGRTAAAFNHVMAHALPADPWLRMAGGALRYKLFGSGGPSVRLGCGDWLFLSEELRPWPDGEAVARERLEGVAQVARRLEAEGATVILALTPDKARVEHRHLCGLDYAAQAAARHDAAMRELRQTGLRVVEWLPVLEAATAGGDVYYRSDTHWNQRGAALAANAVAEAARDVALRRDDVVRTNTAAGETTHAGDLLRLMSLDRAPDALRPAPDRQRLEATTATAAGGGGLLDAEPEVEVVLLGSSYSLNGNFHGALQQALSARVLNFGRAGGGVTGGAREYLASATARETRPKLVVWELLERGLGQPMSAEERAFLTRWSVQRNVELR
jgi:alginate O-acetyltransferase complex protein AlgJ